MFLTEKYMRDSITESSKFWNNYRKVQCDNADNDNVKAYMKLAYKTVKAHVSRGNMKLGKDTLIFNAGTATDCPSIRLGYCQAGKACYALKAEKQYPQSYPYRTRQSMLYHNISALLFANMIVKIVKNSRTPIKYFRYNESGDFDNQKQINWFTKVCSILEYNGIKCYGYTARADLDIVELSKHSQVNVSNDKFDNTLDINRFKMMIELSSKIDNTCLCSADSEKNCSDCNLCKESTGLIQVLKH
jgi:hypothetical protein